MTDKLEQAIEALEVVRDFAFLRIGKERSDLPKYIRKRLNEVIADLRSIEPQRTVSREAIERAMDCIYLDGDTMGSSIQGEEQAVKNLLALQLHAPQPSTESDADAHIFELVNLADARQREIDRLTALLNAQPRTEEVREAVEEIEEARMTVLDSMEKQSTVKTVIAYLDAALAKLDKGGTL